MIKYPVEKCECGIDLTLAIPPGVTTGSEGEPVSICPNCGKPYVMVEEKVEPAAP